MAFVYIAEGHDSIKIGETRGSNINMRESQLKNEFGEPTGYSIKLLIKCPESKEVERKFLDKYNKYKIEKYKGSTFECKSRESFKRKKLPKLCRKMKKHANKKRYDIIIDNPEYEYHNFKKILDERGTGHNIKFYVEWINGEKSWVRYHFIPEEYILSEGFKTHDQRDIPDAPEDDNDTEYRPPTSRKRTFAQSSRSSKRPRHNRV